MYCSSSLANSLGKYHYTYVYIIYYRFIYDREKKLLTVLFSFSQDRHEGFEENGERLAISRCEFRHNDHAWFEHDSRVSKGKEFSLQVRLFIRNFRLFYVRLHRIDYAELNI